MKKVPTDPRLGLKHKAPSSNTHWYIPNELLGLPSSGAALHHVHTTDAPLSSFDLDNTISDMSDGSVAQCPTASEWVVGDATNKTHTDETDGHKIIDPLRTQEAIEHYKKKISRIMKAIKSENQAKEENVNEYLQLSSAASADKIQSVRIKAVFEKKNQKSTHLISQLQRKLEISLHRLKDVETHGVSVSSRQGKGVLKDVGHGIKTIVSKPKEFAHLLRNKFGSADNISGLESLQNDPNSEETRPVRRGSITFPSHFKFHSTDNMMAYNSEIGTVLFHTADGSGQRLAQTDGSDTLSNEDLCFAMKQVEKSRAAQNQLQNSLTELQCCVEDNQIQFKQALEEEKVRREHLEEQINDLMELYQNEVSNLKQELLSIEEKMEYQLEERTRDMQDLLESCQTKITKMDMQQQQQLQLISMEGFDNSTLRTLVTKLINVVLALLAVLLVLINTVTNLLEPFVSTRVRCFVTFASAATVAIIWRGFDHLSDASATTSKWLGSFVNQ